MSPWQKHKAIQILHLEDSVIDHQIVVRALQKQGLACTLQRVETLAAFTKLTGGSTPFDLILADYRQPGFTAIDAWHALLQQARQLHLVLV